MENIVEMEQTIKALIEKNITTEIVTRNHIEFYVDSNSTIHFNEVGITIESCIMRDFTNRTDERFSNKGDVIPYKELRAVRYCTVSKD